MSQATVRTVISVDGTLVSDRTETITIGAARAVAPAAVAAPRFTAGQQLILRGGTFEGHAKVEKMDGGDVILRLSCDARSGRQGVRVRVYANEIDRMLTPIAPATAANFRLGDTVQLYGSKYTGQGVVYRKNDDGSVSVNVLSSGKKIRVFGQDLQDGRLIRL